MCRCAQGCSLLSDLGVFGHQSHSSQLSSEVIDNPTIHCTHTEREDIEHPDERIQQCSTKDRLHALDTGEPTTV